MDTSALPIWYPVLVAGIFSLLAGSFFNVVIYRMPRGESVVWPPSRCQGCGYQVRFYDNVPVLSWVFLRGRCRSCGSSISVQYPLVEALTGLMGAGLWLYFSTLGASLDLGFKLGLTYLALSSIPIIIIDLRHFLIPDVLSLPGILIGLALSLIPGGLTPLESLVGAAGAGGFLWLVGFTATRVLKKEAMGFGDVKLLSMAGALFGLGDAMLGLVLASFLGTMVGLPQLLFRKLDEHHHIPFGPYICVGVFLAACFGETLLDWYFGMFQG